MEIKTQPDIRIFNLYCFLNFSGYNEENNKEGMHLVRVSVREALEKFKGNPDLEPLISYYNKFYEEKRIHLFHFNKYALSLSLPPKLEIVQDTKAINFLPGLDRILRISYEGLLVENLWKEFLPKHLEEAEKYQEAASEIFTETCEYLKIQDESLDALQVIPNLLESYHRGKSIKISETLYIIEGPTATGEPNMRGVAHELTHHLINPILDNLAEKIAGKISFFEKVPRTPQVLNSYKTWDGYFSENLTRAIATKVHAKMNDVSEDKVNAHLEQEEDRGFILERKIYDALKESYEGKDIQFKEFLDSLLEGNTFK